MSAIDHADAPATTRRSRLVSFLVAGALQLPSVWTQTARSRRLLHIGLCAPGFALVFATPLHGQLLLSLIGGVLFALAVGFRAMTEPVFAQADSVCAASPFHNQTEAHPHA